MTVRSRAAVWAGRGAGAASRRLGRGSGEVIGGRLALRVDPALMSRLAAGRVSACVSGTNGKTTTTRLLRAAMATAGPVASNAGGANMSPGVTAALMADRLAPTAVLEVDEMYLPVVARAVRPSVVVLLNVTRDQLDRSNETRRIARRWRDVGAELPTTTAVANVDDPLVVWAAQGYPRQVWVAAGQRWQLDAQVCPACGAVLSRPGVDQWHCDGCGLRRPTPALAVRGLGLLDVCGEEVALRLALPGRVNAGNACLAVAAAQLLGVAPQTAADAMAAVREVEGRYARTELAGARVRLLLAKNPAGWQEMLSLLTEDAGVPVVLGFNARVADGRDPSWIWDVPLEQLRGRPVAVYGDRAADMAVRLAYAGVAHQVTGSAADAVRSVAAGTGPERAVDLLATYTAFREVTAAAGPFDLDA
jgi:UDP-N-acetylmuramyl tripeptide synthase